MFSNLTVKFLINFEFILACGVGRWSFILLKLLGTAFFSIDI